MNFHFRIILLQIVEAEVCCKFYLIKGLISAINNEMFLLFVKSNKFRSLIDF